MPIKNYTTKVPANRSIQEIQDSLVKHGASGVLLEYEKGTGRIEALKFKIEIKGETIPFRLPTGWRQFQKVLRQQQPRERKWLDEDACYRVAWRVLRDWVMSQMALIETEMVKTEQVFLPYAITQDGVSTLYERVLNSNLLLTSGNGN